MSNIRDLKDVVDVSKEIQGSFPRLRSTRAIEGFERMDDTA